MAEIAILEVKVAEIEEDLQEINQEEIAHHLGTEEVDPVEVVKVVAIVEAKNVKVIGFVEIAATKTLHGVTNATVVKLPKEIVVPLVVLLLLEEGADLEAMDNAEEIGAHLEEAVIVVSEAVIVVETIVVLEEAEVVESSITTDAETIEPDPTK